MNVYSFPVLFASWKHLFNMNMWQLRFFEHQRKLKVNVMLVLRLYSEVTIWPKGMWWHHGRVYIWMGHGPLMMMVGEHLRLPIRMREDKNWRQKYIWRNQRFDSEASSVLLMCCFQSFGTAGHYHTDSEAYLKWPYLSLTPHRYFPQCCAATATSRYTLTAG